MKLSRSVRFSILALIVLTSGVLAACTEEPEPVTIIKEVPVEVIKEVEVEKEVIKEVRGRERGHQRGRGRSREGGREDR